MTEAEKKALTGKLAAKKDSLFDARYSEDNRKWFVRKTIDRLIAGGTTDPQVEPKTKEFITNATAALKPRLKKGFSTGTLQSKWAIFNDITSRIQIIYGAIAMHPQFLDAAFKDYFDFIVERRFRMVKRIIYFVNPNNVRNVFAYADDVCNQRKLNKDATPLWSGLVAGSLPFALNATGKADPVKANEEIFKKNKNCDKNILPCDPVATILQMDSLLEAKDKNKLLKQLVTEGSEYLKVDHPFAHYGNFDEGGHLFAMVSAPGGTGIGTNVEVEIGNVGQFLFIYKGTGLDETTVNNNQYFALSEDMLIYKGNDSAVVRVTGVNPGTRKIKIQQLNTAFPMGAKIYWHKLPFPAYHFLTDSRPDKALFEQEVISLNDLQVGDHVYIRNHPLYGIYYPSGAWGGEHSFVIEIGDRDISGSTFDGSLLVAGHGLSYTILDMGTDMLNWINNVLAVFSKMIKIHITHLKTHGYTSDLPKVKVIPKTENAHNFRYFEYDVPFKADNYRTAGLDDYTAGFVLKEENTDPQRVQVFNSISHDSSLPSPASAVIAFIGTNFTTEKYKLSKWGVKFFNSEKIKFESVPLYESNDITEKILDFHDLKQSAPFVRLHNTGDVLVTRPRVDFSAPYHTFLKTNGAY